MAWCKSKQVNQSGEDDEMNEIEEQYKEARELFQNGTKKQKDYALGWIVCYNYLKEKLKWN